MKKITVLFIAVMSVFIFAGLTRADDSFSKNLYFGIQKDSDVTKLQEFLTSEGLYSGPITGNFFSLTMKAVRDFQARESISPAAGYFGPLTRARANQVLGSQIQGSNEQAINETGTAPTSTPNPKTTNDIVTSLQDQINLLTQQLTLLQQQQNSVSAIQQSVQQSQVTLQQIQQNTTPTPAPTLTFELASYLKVEGDSHRFYLSWSSTNAISCLASNYWSGAQPLSGNNVLADIGWPNKSATFTLTCSGTGGSVSKSITWNAPPPPPPQLALFTLGSDGGGISRLKTISGGQILTSSSSGPYTTNQITGETTYFRIVYVGLKQEKNYLSTPDGLTVEVTAPDVTQNKTINLKIEKCITQYSPAYSHYCPNIDGIEYTTLLTNYINYQAKIGTHRLTFFSPELNSTASVDIIIQ